MNRITGPTDANRQYHLGLIGLVLVLSVLSAHAAGWVTARWVADGDTIVLHDGRHVRYIGIDTPEIDHERQRAAPMGYQARSTNRRLIDGWQLRLDYDREAKDRYERTLAYVYRRDGMFVNAELLKLGCAHLLYQYPNTKKFKTLLAAQQDAMRQGRGLWRLINKNENPSHALVGNRRSKRFHAHDCPRGRQISKKNRIRLKNRWKAHWQGYSPARGCIQFLPE